MMQPPKAHDPRNGPEVARSAPPDFLAAAARSLGVNIAEVKKSLGTGPGVGQQQRRRGAEIQERDYRLGVGGEKLSERQKMAQKAHEAQQTDALAMPVAPSVEDERKAVAQANAAAGVVPHNTGPKLTGALATTKTHIIRDNRKKEEQSAQLRKRVREEQEGEEEDSRVGTTDANAAVSQGVKVVEPKAMSRAAKADKERLEFLFGGKKKKKR